MQNFDGADKEGAIRTVKSRAGTVSGFVGDGVKSFLGIPYASDTGGENRFRAPSPPPLLDNFEAFGFSEICPQSYRRFSTHGENCLSLNIWAPDDEKTHPVLIYIHGGSFMSGTGSSPLFNGSKLAKDQNLAVVTFNYRLGALGFLDFSFLGGGTVANPGFHDVIMLLQWVRDNIESYGGDPDLITVMGESAGGTVASILPCVHEAANLLAGVVISSGIPTGLITKEKGRENALKYLDFMGVDSLEALRKIPAEVIGNRSQEFGQYIESGITSYLPVVDGDLIPDFPMRMVRRGEMADLPLFIGATGEEASFLRYDHYKESWGVESIIDAGGAKEEPDFLEQMFKCYEGVYGDNTDLHPYSDIFIRLPLFLYAREVAAHQHVWLYRLDWYSRLQGTVGIKAFHSSDLFFFFGNLVPSANINTTILKNIPFDPGKPTDALMTKIIYGSGINEAEDLSRRMRDDLAMFVRMQELPWVKAQPQNLVAKFYDVPGSTGEIMPPEILKFWKSTEYYKDCLDPLR